ncbi:Conserved hypothetical protein [Vibrio coralliirubri]|uniref:hypothetical protein n=1 Tax=Vibrio coralliirubri TaxID=1516159 RepID=UPI0006300D28|nr:hypothetical protein [Vibrio coralliirubri]CDT81220.1 Conserved hypothetical protein [Vibrio coralliirubri]
MMRLKQNGAVTLLLVSILLIGVLIVSLGSFKTTFYQIKRAQNEVQARKDHWIAEGGLECGLSVMIENSSTAIPSDLLDSCSNKLSSLDKSSDNANILVSTVNRTSINKEILFSNDSGLGAIQAISALEIISEDIMDVDPELSETGSNGVYECVAVRFFDSVTHTKGTGGSLTTVSPPENAPSDFSGCKEAVTDLSESATITASGSNPSGAFKSDYVHDTNLNGFENYFGVRKTTDNINALKSNEYEVINLLETDSHGNTVHVDFDSNTNKYVGKECSTRINDAFSAGKTNVWVVGDCVVWHPAINIVDSAGTITPRSLVVENGIFANGNASVFDGAFYHLNDMSVFEDISGAENNTDLLADSWDKLPATMDYSSLVKENSTYIANASFFPKGGIFLDSIGGLSTIKGSMNLDYRGDYNPHDEPVEIQWKKGSWSDF